MMLEHDKLEQARRVATHDLEGFSIEHKSWLDLKQHPVESLPSGIQSQKQHLAFNRQLNAQLGGAGSDNERIVTSLRRDKAILEALTH